MKLQLKLNLLTCNFIPAKIQGMSRGVQNELCIVADNGRALASCDALGDEAKNS